MGLKFKEIVTKQEISLHELKGKILAVDSMNLLYQFLTTIRGPDGSSFTDTKGRVTSHLIGLFNRTTTLMEYGLKLVFVFDGKAPEIKLKTWEKRAAVKEQASLQLEKAKDEGDLAAMKRYSSRTVVLTKDMIEDAKRVITALGLPIVQAPSEGEAQTAYMAKQGDAYASVSQDYDNLIFGCPTLVRNLSVVGKRKKMGSLGYTIVKPEVIFLKDVLKTLSLTQDQLIILAMLVGTDYNPEGIKGIGPKKGLKLVQDYQSPEKIFAAVDWNTIYPDLHWKILLDTIKHIPVTDSYSLEWKKFDEKTLLTLLKSFDFDEERIKSKLNKLDTQNFQQKGLRSFF